jgi:hypothetical protein
MVGKGEGAVQAKGDLIASGAFRQRVITTPVPEEDDRFLPTERLFDFFF